MRETTKRCLYLAAMLLFLLPPARAEVLAVRGGKILTITKGTIEAGTILIEDGKIQAVGSGIPIPEGARIIEAAGKVICPGFIDSFTNVGTRDLFPGESDFDEAGTPVSPQMRIIDALNPDNRFIPLERRSGVTAAIIAPGEANLISGQGAVIRLWGTTIEEMIVKFPAALHGSLGELPKIRYGSRNQYPSTRMGQAALLRQTLIDAQGYREKMRKPPERGSDPPPADFKMKPLVPVLEGELPLVIRANRYDDILTALRIAEEFRIRIILNHGAEAHRAAGRLAGKGIPVLYGPFTSTLQGQEAEGARPDGPLLLVQAGVKVAFQTGRTEDCSRLLDFVRDAVKNGLSRKEALEALTIHPAEIFGIDKRIGSIEEGKEADLLIWDGDPLDIQARITHIIIKGKLTGRD